MLQKGVESVLGRADLVAVLVDDLHFADVASCEMLQALACADTLRDLRWTLAQRPGEGSAAADGLRDALEEARLLDTVALAPLDESAMAELVDSLGLPELDGRVLAPVLVRHTGGNPLYALETLKQGLAQGRAHDGALDARRLPLPGSVGSLIERRLRKLSERALGLARLAAVAGVDFSIALAEAVTGVRALDLASAWGELEAAHVLREHAFAHDLVYDAVLRSIPAPIERHLHAAVAGWLEAKRGEPARIARHYLDAVQPAQAAPHLLEAAKQARDALRNLEAATMLEKLADLHHAAGDVAAELCALEELRTVLSYVDDRARKQAVLLRIRERADTEERRAQADLALARAHFEDRSMTDAHVHAQAALSRAQRVGDRDLVGRARLELALVLIELSRPTEGQEQLDLARDWALTSVNVEYRFTYHYTLAWVAMAGEHFTRAIRAYEDCLAMPELRDDRAQYAGVLGNLAVVLGRQGAMAKALHFDQQRRSMLEPNEVVGSSQNYLELNAALLLGFAGRFAEALSYFERAEQRAVPDQRMLHARWAHFWMQLGQHARALRHAEQALTAASGHPLNSVLAMVTRLRTLHALAAPAQDVLATLREIDEITGSEGSKMGTVRRLLAWAEFGPVAMSDEHCRQALHVAEAGGLQGLVLAAATLCCEAAIARGDADAALDAADRAMPLREEFASDIASRTRVALALACALLHRDREQAEDLVRNEAAWLLETASSHVPASFRESFRARNPHHRALLAWSSRMVLPG